MTVNKPYPYPDIFLKCCFNCKSLIGSPTSEDNELCDECKAVCGDVDKLRERSIVKPVTPQLSYGETVILSRLDEIDLKLQRIICMNEIKDKIEYDKSIFPINDYKKRLCESSAIVETTKSILSEIDAIRQEIADRPYIPPKKYFLED